MVGNPKKYKDDKQKLQQNRCGFIRRIRLTIGFLFANTHPVPIIIGLYQAIIRVLGGSPVQLIDLLQCSI